MTYTVTLPKDPVKQPNKTGVGGTTWNFELRPTFWFGLTLCDDESAPEFTKKCTPDSDSNNLVGANPAAPNYIGKHPGTAFMELQFYGHRDGSRSSPEIGCAAHQYCAAMTIDSFSAEHEHRSREHRSLQQLRPRRHRASQLGVHHQEREVAGTGQPAVHRDGHPPQLRGGQPGSDKALFMNPGDRVQIHMQDTPAGLRIVLNDLTSGQHGSMTASVSNGFGHILFTPKSKTCHEAPYAFHPAYSTANPRGTVWAAHTYNVAFSDELDHFENCLAVNTTTGNCTKPARRTRPWTRTTPSA